jgi:hypothetical protein
MKRTGHSHLTPTVVLAVAAIIALVAACNDSRSCESSDDCFSDESCVGGTCLLDEGGERREDADSGGSDAGEDATRGEKTSCIVDPITAPSCTDEYEGETNNDSSIRNYRFEFLRAGCVNMGEFTPAEATLSATQCWDEHEDWYGFTMDICRDYQFRIQADVTPAKNCDTPLELRGADCEDSNVRCETLEDGTLRMTRIIPRSRPAGVPVDFGVISTVDNQQVDYTISVKVYR